MLHCRRALEDAGSVKGGAVSIKHGTISGVSSHEKEIDVLEW